MENNFTCSIRENGIAIESGNEKFIIAFERLNRQGHKATGFAEEKGGKLPTINQAMVIKENLEQINETLKEAGKPILRGTVWLEDMDPHRATHKRTFDLGNGFITGFAIASSCGICVILPFTDKTKKK